MWRGTLIGQSIAQRYQHGVDYQELIFLDDPVQGYVRCMDMYMNDNTFRDKIFEHTNLALSGSMNL